jgi:uncharacterized membrane protein YphA (DoxX/SURF4 family)
MISDKTLSIMLFLQRIIFALAMAFFATGEALHLNAFIQNGIDIGLPSARIVCTAVVILTFISAFLILTGFAFRASVAAMMLICMFSGFFFFAGSFNKVNVTGVLFAFVILTGFLITGAGRISLSCYLEKKKMRDNKRISFR